MMNSYEMDAARVLRHVQAMIRSDGGYIQWYIVPSPDQPNHHQGYRVLLGYEARSLYWIGITINGTTTRREQIPMVDLPGAVAEMVAAILNGMRIDRPHPDDVAPDDPYLARMIGAGYDQFESRRAEYHGADPA